MSEMGKINTFFSSFSELMAAAGFAEEGDRKTALQILEETDRNYSNVGASRNSINKVKLSAR
jgi:hypothetical protein